MLTLQEAIGAANSAVKGRNIMGYWIKDGEYIFNMLNKDDPRLCECTLFKVLSDGRVIGTNPVLTPVALKDMKRL